MRRSLSRSLIAAAAMSAGLACQTGPRIEPMHVLEPWEAVAGPPPTAIPMPEDELTIVLATPDGSRRAFVFVREADVIEVHDLDGTLLATAGPALR